MKESIIQALATKDPIALEHIYEEFFDPIYRFLYHKILHRETAEDLTSITFVKVFQSIHRFNPKKASLKTWMYTIARNTLTDYFRTSKPSTAPIEEIWDLSSDEPTPWEEVDQLLTNKKLREAMKQLSSEEREILTLRFWQGYSFKEIGEILGKETGTVKVACFRAVKKLQPLFPLFYLLLTSLHHASR